MFESKREKQNRLLEEAAKTAQRAQRMGGTTLVQVKGKDDGGEAPPAHHAKEKSYSKFDAKLKVRTDIILYSPYCTHTALTILKVRTDIIHCSHHTLHSLYTVRRCAPIFAGGGSSSSSSAVCAGSQSSGTA
jgi:hypothetical protein